MITPFRFFRQLPMKKRPTETIHVMAEQQPLPEGETPAPPTPQRFERLPRAVIGIYLFLALSLVIYLIGIFSPAFADFFNRYISSCVRAVTATLTGWIPFSLAETLLLFLPVITLGEEAAPLTIDTPAEAIRPGKAFILTFTAPAEL